MKKQGKKFGTKRDAGSIQRALTGVKPLDGGQATDLGLGYRMALECLRSGHGQEAHVHTLACTSNISLVLAERGYGSDWIGQIKLAQDGIMRCFGRGKRTGKWGLDGEGITEITKMVALHDAQMKIALQRDIRAAIDEVHARMNRGDVLEVTA